MDSRSLAEMWWGHGESLLTLAGYYVGREFRFTGVRSLWMASQGQIKFYSDDAVLRVAELGTQLNKAA